MQEVKRVYPYIPNSAPEIREEMMRDIKISSLEELLTVIPSHLRYQEELNIPKPMLSEVELSRHVKDIMNRNISCEEYSSFLGAGCYQHFVPSVCDEINSRAEFLTAYTGDTYSDHGKNQAIFEYSSEMAELLDMDMLSFTYYDGGQAVCTALRMAGRISGRREVLIPASISPFYLSQMRDYCRVSLDIVLVDFEPDTGRMDLTDLKRKLSEKTAAVFIENPTYMGVMEEQVLEIGRLAHENGALFVVCPDVASLGILEAPGNYGADIVCGELQPLGMHQNYGGGCAGFIATPQEKRYIDEHTTYLYSIVPTKVEGQYGFSRMFPLRTSHGSREKAKEYYGTSAGLWCITAAVYLAVMGPEGMRELGENILCRSNYLKKKLAALPGVRIPLSGATFQEFVVDFNQTGKTVAQINDALLSYKIFGGKDLSQEFPAFGQSALYCVTEIQSLASLDALCSALADILK